MTQNTFFTNRWREAQGLTLNYTYFKPLHNARWQTQKLEKLQNSLDWQHHFKIKRQKAHILWSPPEKNLSKSYMGLKKAHEVLYSHTEGFRLQRNRILYSECHFGGHTTEFNYTDISHKWNTG